MLRQTTQPPFHFFHFWMDKTAKYIESNHPSMLTTTLPPFLIKLLIAYNTTTHPCRIVYKTCKCPLLGEKLTGDTVVLQISKLECVNYYFFLSKAAIFCGSHSGLNSRTSKAVDELVVIAPQAAHLRLRGIVILGP